MSTPPLPDRPRLPWDPPDHFEKRIPDGDNRERLVCARCEFIHYQNPKIVAGAVCTWGDRILLAKRAIEPRKGFWTVPAGYMELGETTEQAAEREAREEACATIEIDRLLAMYSVARIGQVQIMYRARLASALAHFHDARGKVDFATYSNPTGELARMWPPRKPAGV